MSEKEINRIIEEVRYRENRIPDIYEVKLQHTYGDSRAIKTSIKQQPNL